MFLQGYASITLLTKGLSTLRLDWIWIECALLEPVPIRFQSRPHYVLAKWIGITKSGRVHVLSRDKNAMWACPCQKLRR